MFQAQQQYAVNNQVRASPQLINKLSYKELRKHSVVQYNTDFIQVR